MPHKTIEMTYEQWRARGAELFGPDMMQWRFVCPCCGHVASVQDYKDAGAKEGNVGFSCIGRWLPKARDAFAKGAGPCNYAGGGLFRLNPIHVTGPLDSEAWVMAFDETAAPATRATSAEEQA